jgi:hypothetical protein
MEAAGKISSLLLDEYFAAADDRFLPMLRQLHEPKRLAAIAEKWKKDHRPWARNLIFDYLSQPFDSEGHEPIIKRHFKHAEQTGDDELMSAFAVAFDRMVRRVRKTRWQFDFQSRGSWQEEYLKSPRDVLRVRQIEIKFGPQAGSTVRVPSRGNRLFTYHTRYYLRRRAWRYFRRMAHKRPNEYPAAVAKLLARYSDADVAKGENLLDNWSLIHACFRESDVLEFAASHVRIKEGRNLSELKAAPDFPDLWKKPKSGTVLVDLLAIAPCRGIRVWTMQLLREHHRAHFAQVTPDQLLPLLDSEDEEVQQFAAEMLEQGPDLSKLDLATWLRLLQTRNPTALEIIASAMAKHVAGERLTLQQVVQLASARPVPVARLGLRFLKERTIRSTEDLTTLAELANLRSAGTAAEATAFALSILGTKENYNVDRISRFFDSLVVEARTAAFAWLTPESPGYNDPALWSRLTESPYDDVRIRVIAELERRKTLPGAAADQLETIWTSVLLAIHRGNRAKLAALRQISSEIRHNPNRAQSLLPVLAVAIRSVRIPEARAGLASIVSAVEAHPDLIPALGKHLPELQITAEVTP